MHSCQSRGGHHSRGSPGGDQTTQESKTTTKVDVDVPEEKKSKVLQDLTGTASKDSESVGSVLTRIFGSKVLFTVHH